MGAKLEEYRRKTRKEYSAAARIPSGCAVFGAVNEQGIRFSGSAVLEGISMMHERSNGLGGGFAGYGIYPQFETEWAFHLMYEDTIALQDTEEHLRKSFKIVLAETIPTNPRVKVSSPPLFYRYFLRCRGDMVDREEDYIVQAVMGINRSIPGAFVVSSGKNMGIFKGVGYPEQIGSFFRIEDYEGYLWTSHGRFPTNSMGWWGGAHPFGLLDWSVVHNGEISSYGSNKRFVSNFGYECSLSTDTEVITYMFDLLSRKLKVDLRFIHLILASPLWEEIERMPQEAREVAGAFRIIYGSALLNGPFNIIVGNSRFLYALNDRVKLRPMVAAKQKDFLYISSEEAAIRKVCPDPEQLWRPAGGEPVIAMVQSSNKTGLNEKERV